MPAPEVVPFPKHLARLCVQARGPKAAEMDINPARLEHRRRRRVTIHRSAIAERFRIIAVEYFFVEANRSGLGVQTDRKKVMAVLHRRRHPNLAVHHDWS